MGFLSSIWWQKCTVLSVRPPYHLFLVGDLFHLWFVVSFVRAQLKFCCCVKGFRHPSKLVFLNQKLLIIKK